MIVVAVQRAGKIHCTTLNSLISLPKDTNIVFVSEEDTAKVFPTLTPPLVWLGYGASCDVKELVKRSTGLVNVVPTPYRMDVQQVGREPELSWDVKGINVRMVPNIWTLMRRVDGNPGLTSLFTATTPTIVTGVNEVTYVTSSICQ